MYRKPEKIEATDNSVSQQHSRLSNLKDTRVKDLKDQDCRKFDVDPDISDVRIGTVLASGLTQ